MTMAVTIIIIVNNWSWFVYLPSELNRGKIFESDIAGKRDGEAERASR